MNQVATNEDENAPVPSSLVDSAGKNSLIVTALEHLAWGRNYGSCYPHRRCACQHHRNWSELSSINSQATRFLRSSIATAVNFPERAVAETLVLFHIRHMVWHHNCLHSPTFLEQCNTFWETGRCDQPQWIALYFSVLATSLFCLQNSRKHQVQYAVESISHSAKELVETMTSILYESNFLMNVSLYSIQAIVISTEVTHNLGLSQLNATLFSAAIRMAECLGLHKIEVDDAGLLNPVENWHESLEREVGRRVWLQMIVQDHFAIPFTDSYGIHPAHYSTHMPKNADDSDMVAMPDDIPTISTYTRVLGTIALLMPELVDGMGPMKARKPVHEQYEHILRIDQKMRQVVRKIPRCLLQPDEVLDARLPWLGIARQSLSVTAAEKIIMIHRPFIFRSFQSAAYAHTRRTCVSAAITILREHNSIVESGELSLWTHTAFCITAALILSFEIMFKGTNESHERLDVYCNAIDVARGHLLNRKDDVLARKGVFLINALFPEGYSVTAEESNGINFEDVVSRFTTDWAFLGPSKDMVTLEDAYYDLQPALDAPASEEFDAWFHHIFSTVTDSFVA
ncbi:C6 zinc finger domain containing protein [Fusarium sp. Ph1]|nr:C6 zinc finger domain containing protein [Fusarium sp. Ph1]